MLKNAWDQSYLWGYHSQGSLKIFMHLLLVQLYGRDEHMRNKQVELRQMERPGEIWRKRYIVMQCISGDDGQEECVRVLSVRRHAGDAGKRRTVVSLAGSHK